MSGPTTDDCKLSDLIKQKDEAGRLKRHFSCSLGHMRFLYRTGSPGEDRDGLTLVYLLQGRAVLQMYNGEAGRSARVGDSRELIPGDVCLLSGLDQAGLAFSGDDPLQAVVTVPGEVVALARRIGLDRPEEQVFHIGRRADMATRARDIGRRLAASGAGERERIVMEVFELVSDVFNLARQDIRKVGDGVKLGDVCRALARDLHERLSIPDLAARFHMSYTAFRREFARLMGMPPGEYRIRQRIESIKILLSRSLSIKEAAARFGYPDLQSFSKQFKKMTGVTPRQFQAASLA